MAFKLTYKIDGEIFSEQAVEAGTAITAPTPEEREGYDFSGWQDIPEVMPESDVTVEGSYAPDAYTLTVMLDEEIWKSLVLSSGDDISDITAPEKRGYTFSGWVKKYKKMPRSNLTLRGTYHVNTYKLTFEVDGMIFENEVEFGTPLDFVLSPERDNHTFSGWGKIPATMPDRDLHFKGSFKPTVYTITFVLDGKEYHRETLPLGAAITPPKVADKENATFSGWKKVPETMPGEDIKVEGKYRIKKYKATFFVEEKKYAWVSLSAGAVITPPDEPSVKGKVFVSWDTMPETMPEKNIEIHAIFREEA